MATTDIGPMCGCGHSRGGHEHNGTGRCHNHDGGQACPCRAFDDATHAPVPGCCFDPAHEIMAAPRWIFDRDMMGHQILRRA